MRSHFLFALTLLVLSCVSCRTPIFSLESLEPGSKSSLDLPHLAFEVEPESFGRVYQRGLQTVVEGDDVSTGTAIIQTQTNPQIPDLYAISERTLYQWISRPYDTQYGFGRVRMIGVSQGNAGFGFLLVSCMTAFIPNLVGFPLGKPTAEISLDFEILDREGRILGSYRGTGEASQLIGFYYGKTTGSQRYVHASALKEAWEEIYTQLAADRDRIETELLRVGPVLRE